jgi:hypothetical protein
MFQKWIGILIIVGILFSYFPVMSFQHRPEGSHYGNHRKGSHKEEGKLNCGYVFYCPFTLNPSFSEPLVTLNTEKLVPISSSITFGDFRFPIFHPLEEKV